MQRAYYHSSIEDFLKEEAEQIHGKLLIQDEFKTSDLQKNAWREEIDILKGQLSKFSQGEIAFEYTIPRIGHRVDVVCIINGLIFLLEFKVGKQEYKKSTDDQVMDYALDLKYFHELSRGRYIIPISIPTEASDTENEVHFMEDHIAEVLHFNRNTICRELVKVLSEVQDAELHMEGWLNSRYAPTPTIFEAAQVIVISGFGVQ